MMCLSVRCYWLASCLLSPAGSPPKAHGGGATFNLSNAQYITSVLSVNLPIFLSSAYACLTATHVLQRFHVIFDMIFSAFQHISNENTHFSSTNVDGAASVNGGNGTARQFAKHHTPAGFALRYAFKPRATRPPTVNGGNSMAKACMENSMGKAKHAYMAAARHRARDQTAKDEATHGL